MDNNRYLIWQNIITSKRWLRIVAFSFGIYSVLIILIVGIRFVSIGELKIVLLALLGFAIARFIVSPLVFFWYKKQRPYQKFGFTPLQSKLFSTVTTRYNAFPSDHAVSFASIGGVYFYASHQAGALVFILAVLNGWARIVLGYHDEWDVLAGWVIGLGVSAAVLATARAMGIIL